MGDPYFDDDGDGRMQMPRKTHYAAKPEPISPEVAALQKWAASEKMLITDAARGARRRHRACATSYRPQRVGREQQADHSRRPECQLGIADAAAARDTEGQCQAEEVAGRSPWRTSVFEFPPENDSAVLHVRIPAADDEDQDRTGLFAKPRLAGSVNAERDKDDTPPWLREERTVAPQPSQAGGEWTARRARGASTTEIGAGDFLSDMGQRLAGQMRGKPTHSVDYRAWVREFGDSEASIAEFTRWNNAEIAKRRTNSNARVESLKRAERDPDDPSKRLPLGDRWKV